MRGSGNTITCSENQEFFTRIIIHTAERRALLFFLSSSYNRDSGNIEEENRIAIVHHLIDTYVTSLSNYVSYLRISNICVLRKIVDGGWVLHS